MSDGLKFRHLFSFIGSGPNGSGNSSFLIRFIQNLAYLCTEPTFAGGIVWCYGEKSTVPSRQKLPAYVKYNESVPEEFGSANGEPCLVFPDDLLNDVYSKQLCEMFTRSSHHRNIRVILITQNLFHQGRFSRDISLNAHYIVAMKNVRDKKQFIYLAGQVYPEDCLGLYNA